MTYSQVSHYIRIDLYFIKLIYIITFYWYKNNTFYDFS